MREVGAVSAGAAVARAAGRGVVAVVAAAARPTATVIARCEARRKAAHLALGFAEYGVRTAWIQELTGL